MSILKPRSYAKKILFVVLLFLLSISSPLALYTKNAAALSGSDFRAGRIIDNDIFFNRSDLTVAQIQQFLDAKLPSCDTNGALSKSYYFNSSTGEINNDNGVSDGDAWVTTNRATYGQRYNAYFGVSYASAPYTCLKGYQADTTSKPVETGLCNGYPISNQSAAEIIYNVAQSCGVSSRMLIVLLQKEQGLVTDDWPWGKQYRSATGFGCPDTAACDSQYYGFFNQVYSAARQFKKYAQSPGSYNYLSGRNNFIAYNPSSSCGGSSVYIYNQATAGLYNYTPYQPNPASLASMNDSTPGGSVTCGAYGNRNFFWYFTKWFGPPIRDLISTAGGGIYLVEEGIKRVFPNEITFLSYSYKWSDVLVTSYSEMSRIPDGPAMPYNVHFRNGHLVTSVGAGMYVVDNGVKRPFPNEGTFFSYGYKFSDALAITNAEINLIPDGAAMPYDVHLRDGHLVTFPGGGMNVVANGLKKPFPNEVTFLSYKYRPSDALIISYAEMNLIPDGPAMPYNVHFRNGHLVTSVGAGMYVVDNGVKRPFPNEGTFFSYGYKFSDALAITNAEINLIPDGAAMPSKQ